jgi:hypothetical protein
MATKRPKPNKRRLLKMADFVLTIPKKEFDMEHFGHETDCGFIGCALGHAAHRRIFRGLRFENGNIVYSPTPHGRKTRGGFDAARKLFNIRFDNTMGLFFNHDLFRTDTRAQVARRIRKFVEAQS